MEVGVVDEWDHKVMLLMEMTVDGCVKKRQMGEREHWERRERKLRAPVSTMKYVSPFTQQRWDSVSLHVRQQNLPYHHHSQTTTAVNIFAFFFIFFLLISLQQLQESVTSLKPIPLPTDVRVHVCLDQYVAAMKAMCHATTEPKLYKLWNKNKSIRNNLFRI